jgi:hypothetical protein
MSSKFFIWYTFGAGHYKLSYIPFKSAEEAAEFGSRVAASEMWAHFQVLPENIEPQ